MLPRLNKNRIFKISLFCSAMAYVLYMHVPLPVVTNPKKGTTVSIAQPASNTISIRQPIAVPIAGTIEQSKWEHHLPSNQARHDWCDGKNRAFILSRYASKASAHAVTCTDIQRAGASGDGGKLVCTDNINAGNCVVYSLGSRLDFTFEIDIVKRFSCQVHTFDCTVGTPPASTIPVGVSFHPWCIGGEDEMKSISSDLGHQGEIGQYYTLTTIRKKLHHSHIDLLKMDIERHEYAVVASLAVDTIPLQIVFETHLHNAYGMWGRPVSEDEWEALWTKLTSLGYRVFAHEPNPLCLCCCEFSVTLANTRTLKRRDSYSKPLVTELPAVSHAETPMQIDWNNYRLGDAIRQLWQACDEYPDTIACEYQKLTKKAIDIPVLQKVLKAYDDRNSKILQYTSNRTVLHLRLGDGLCVKNDPLCPLDNTKPLDCWHDSRSCFRDPFEENVHSCRFYAMPKHCYTGVVKALVPGQIVTILASIKHFTRPPFDIRNGNYITDLKYRENVATFLRSHGFRVDFRDEGSPDFDFAFLSSAATFVQGGGGWSRLVGEVVLAQGGQVISPGK